jgi:hypothetical protein
LTRFWVTPETSQVVLDALQTALLGSEHSRITLMPVEVSLPRPDKEDTRNGNGRENGKARKAAETTGEELYAEIKKGAHLTTTYVPLVILSTVVAAIGLTENSVAIVIGAMVIAPLLGPSLALAMAAVMGDGPCDVARCR